MVDFSTNYNGSFVGESGPMIVKELSVKSSSLLTRMVLVNHNQKQKKVLTYYQWQRSIQEYFTNISPDTLTFNPSPLVLCCTWFFRSVIARYWVEEGVSCTWIQVFISKYFPKCGCTNVTCQIILSLILVRRGGEVQSGREYRAKGGTGEVRTHFVLSPVGLKRRKCEGRRIRE